jgi:EAL domain-containing protein (putative c-di-GMP-specific phosphodiesterase class I)
VQLRRLPITMLKIDASFVRELAAGPLEGSAVETILGLGRSLSIESIAEGVETAWQLERLRALGTRFAQGYLFSQPLSAGQVSRLFAVPVDS